MPKSLSPILPAKLPRHTLDADAVMVCRRLQEAGHETFLVGGCVRDIILGRTPKDFDVGTLATPNQVRRLFRNCRIIGRRFRLAHIVFGAKIIEVATFRGGDVEGEENEGDPEDKLILRANNFGTPEEDALSRDFTVNGLFYDPIAEKIIDHVQGYQDIRAGLMRTIGGPADRFQEDPVRILRAVKFSSRLGFDVEPETLVAMSTVAQDISRCPMPRVTEEMYRIAESGHMKAAVELMIQTNVLPVMLPEVAQYVEKHRDEYLKHLEVVDLLKRAHGGLRREFVLSLLFYPIALRRLQEADVEPGPAWGKSTEEWFRPIGIRMHVAVKHRMRLRNLMAFVGRFIGEVAGRKPRRMGAHELQAMPQGLTLLRLHQRVYGGVEDAYHRARTMAKEQFVPWVPVSEAATTSPPDDGPPPRRRRRRRRRRARPAEG